MKVMERTLHNARRRRLLSAAVALGVCSSVTSPAGPLAAAEPSTVAEPLTVSYESPPPMITFAPAAVLREGSGLDLGIVEFSVLPDHVVVAVAADRAVTIGGNGVVSSPQTLQVPLTAVVAAPGPTVYGLTASFRGDDLAAAAIPLRGDARGQVVAHNSVDRAAWVELPTAAFGLGPDGYVARIRQPGTVLQQAVDAGGAAITVDGVRGALSFDDTTDSAAGDTAMVTIGDGTDTWTLAVERSADYVGTYVGDSPPAPTTEGRAVYWTAIGPAEATGSDFPPPTLPVIALLDPGGGGNWYSLPDGWEVVASEVWGTLLARRAEGAIELAWLDGHRGIAAEAGAASDPGPVCPSYRWNDRYPMRLCDRSNAVALVQQRLVATVAPELRVDGYFGPNTEAAVLEFQAANGLEIDGLVGEATWQALTGGQLTGDDANGNGLIDPWEVATPTTP